MKQLDDFKSPNGKPWLIIIMVIAAGLLFLWRENKHESDLERVEAEARARSARENERVDPVADPPADVEAPVAAGDTIAVAELLKRSKAQEAKRQFIQAKKGYLQLLSMNIDDAVRKEVEGSLAKINIDLVMTPYSMPEKVDYVVKSGDSLDKIAKKMGTTVDLIARSNNIKNPSRIAVGDVLRVLTAKFKLKVSKTDIDMIVYMNGEFFKRYIVGTGKFGKTPVGTFILTEKQKEPVWWHPSGKSYQFGDKENILGTRWMTLRATGDTPKVSGYGIHGTWVPESIGKAESAGCVRMINSDVEELYTYVPNGTEVEIVE